MNKSLALAIALLAATGAQAACYTVLGSNGAILAQSSTPPVDMSYQLHQTVPQRFGAGASMVFGIADPDCGRETDRYYDLMPAEVAYREGLREPVRAVRAPRRDRE